MQLFQTLEQLLGYLEPEQIERVEYAYQFAKKAHQGQKRDTGEPYIIHPVAVARVLAKLHMDSQSLLAGLLHDVLEDTPVTKAQLEDEFGEQVTALVDGVTKLTQIEFCSRLEEQAENFRKMILSMAKDIRVVIVKLADRLHNMRTLSALSAERRRRKARETLDIYAPVAKRLGMHELSLELEDLGFAILYPRRFQVLSNAVRKEQGDRRRLFDRIKSNILKTMQDKGLECVDISSREKHVYSIYQKMTLKKLCFSDLTDVFACRVIVPTIDDCYRCLGLVHLLYNPFFDKFKDYIAVPKNNGYQSLHTVLFGPNGVPIEMQIRTQLMHELANSGIAAHWAYKAGSSDGVVGADNQIKAQQWLQSLIEMQQRTGSSVEFLENVKVDLYPGEAYVFTPKGRILELPVGATAMDFAYAVHTDIGNHCVAAKIDRQLAPLSSVLSNGQTVEIICSPNATPSPSWLNTVITGKAKSHIRHFLKNQRNEESVNLGKRLLEKHLLDRQMSLKDIGQGQLKHLIERYQLHHVEDLWRDIGLGNRSAGVVFMHLMENNGESKHVETHESPLLIKGTEGMVVEFADCCSPLPGDAIVGMLNVGHGITIHREQCSKVALAADKKMPVSWSDKVVGEFKVKIGLESANKRGTLAQMALAVADSGCSILDISIVEYKTNVAVNLIYILLTVSGRQQLEVVLKKIQNLNVISKVWRVENDEKH